MWRARALHPLIEQGSSQKVSNHGGYIKPVFQLNEMRELYFPASPALQADALVLSDTSVFVDIASFALQPRTIWL
jgi:hypothetical protein